jgi:hypothetical protein
MSKNTEEEVEPQDQEDLPVVMTTTDLTKEDILNMDEGSLLGAVRDLRTEIEALEEELGETAYDEGRTFTMSISSSIPIVLSSLTLTRFRGRSG